MSYFKKLSVFLIAAILLLHTGCTESEQKTITVFNWGDYLNEELLDNFEAETGIRVIYDTFASNEDMWAKFSTSANSYDVVIPSDYMIERMIKNDLIMPLDHEKLPNLANLYPEFSSLSYDPGNRYSAPYFWSSTGIIYNTQKVKEPVDSWNILWNKAYQDKIIMLDVQRTSLMVALKILGYSMNTTNPDELSAAGRLLVEQRPLVLAYAEDNVKDMMLQGEGDLALIWSGEAYVVMNESPDFKYAIPKEGTNLVFDAMVIPKTSEHKDEAYQFINYLLRADVAVKNMETIFYNTPNQAAYQLLPPEKQKLLGALPFASMERGESEIFVDLGDALGLYNQVWTEFKASGQ